MGGKVLVLEMGRRLAAGLCGWYLAFQVAGVEGVVGVFHGIVSDERSACMRSMDFCTFAKNNSQMVIYKGIITIEPGKRGGKPCIRNMRITVEDILRWMAIFGI